MNMKIHHTRQTRFELPIRNITSPRFKLLPDFRAQLRAAVMSERQKPIIRHMD